MKISDKEALTYNGGGITASLINAAANIIKQLYVMGQNLGSTIIRTIRGQSC